MKHFLVFLLLFCWAFAFGQTPIFTAGITYCNGSPAHNPGATGSRYAVDTVAWELYTRTITNSWQNVGSWLQFRTGTGTPAAPPTKYESVFAINAADSLYYYDGATWNHLNPSSSGGITGGGLPGKIGVWYDTDKIAYAIDFVIDTLNNEMGLRTSDPQRTLDVNGEVRIRDLTTDPATKLVGTDTDGDLSSLALGTNLSISNDTLNASGGSGGLTGTGLANRLAYWTAAGAVGYESTLRVDTVNNRLGIGSQDAPSYGLDISNADKEGLRVKSSSTGATGLILENTSTGGKQWVLVSGGSAQPTGSAGDFFYYNNTDGAYSSFSLNTLGETDFFLRRAADIRFYVSGSQAGYVRAADALMAMPFFSAYNDLGFGLAQSTSGNVKGGLNLGSGSLLEWATGTLWYNTKDVGFNRQAANTLNLTNGSTGLGKLRLDKIIGTGATSAAYAVSVVNSNDSTILLVRNDRRVGINTGTPDVSFDAGDNTDQIKLPGGTTAQRAAVNNSIRYNSDVEGFEARENGIWFRITSSQAPSIAAGAAAGTGPTVAIGAGSNDMGGTIEITTGTSTTTGTLATITYGDAFDASLSPHVTITPANDKAAEHMLQWYKGTSGNSSFVLTSRVALDASTLYVFTYQVQQ